MAFVGAFTVTPNPLDPTSFTILDQSSGDTNITDRQISLFLVTGGTLTPAGSTTTYIDWPIGSPSPFPITGLLVQDYSLLISVTWISSNPISGSVYTVTQVYTFTANTIAFIYSLVQQIAAQQTLLNDQDFIQNMGKIQTFLDSAIQAQAYSSQGNAQQMLNFALYMIQNKQLFF